MGSGAFNEGSYSDFSILRELSRLSSRARGVSARKKDNDQGGGGGRYRKKGRMRR